VVARSYGAYVVSEMPPAISGFSPPGGPPGTHVTITGSGFRNDARVSYGGQALLIASRQGDHTMVVEVPRSAARSEPFVVSTRAGETRSGAWFQLALPAVVERMSPTSGPAGTTVTIRGRGFRGDEVFFLGPVPLEVLERRPGTVVVRIPPQARSGELAFESYGARHGTPLRFEVHELPDLESFAPLAGPPGTHVAIRGRHLGDVASVSYGNLPAAIVRRAPRELIVEIPAAAQGRDYLWLHAPAGRVRSGQAFEVTPPPPQPGRFAPTSGMVGTRVTLDGAWFPPGAQVWFRDVACPIVSRGPRRLVFTIPPGAAGRAPFVITDEHGGRVATTTAFEVLLPPPPPPPPVEAGHHEHAHEHPHGDGGHHHHPHVHPHRPGDTHHHPY
jgi:hypothetical protein